MTLTITGIPAELDVKLIDEYLEMKKRYAMSDWGPGQLNGGRFAEVLLRVYQHLIGDVVTPFGTELSAKDKNNLLNRIQSSDTLDDHLRQKTVPLVRLLLDFRNNRDVAHLGLFNANSMDTLFVITSATWVLCEIVRIYGRHPMPKAQEIVEGLSVKQYPVLIERNGEQYIARNDLTTKQEVLVMLTRNPSVGTENLKSKVRDTNKPRVVKTLRDMEKVKLIGRTSDSDYFIMPLGQRMVTEQALLSFKS